MRIFYDTEFIEDGRTIGLISIGMVREDGATYYAESRESPLSKASQWVVDNVLDKLGPMEQRKTLLEIRDDVQAFCCPNGEKPQLWAYYSAYDHVALCQLFGRMIDLPEGWPYLTLDVKQYAFHLGNPQLPPRTTDEHHALSDALWTREAWESLQASFIANVAR